LFLLTRRDIVATTVIIIATIARSRRAGAALQSAVAPLLMPRDEIFRTIAC